MHTVLPAKIHTYTHANNNIRDQAQTRKGTHTARMRLRWYSTGVRSARSTRSCASPTAGGENFRVFCAEYSSEKVALLRAGHGVVAMLFLCVRACA